ncbi:MAG: hypothetical protein BGO69_08400 [Bacteroidetes bacterium 46-16]|nr:MAG: hypothetical protein BGO69_08400 [Bacteroidetes bacterium 46-16]
MMSRGWVIFFISHVFIDNEWFKLKKCLKNITKMSHYRVFCGTGSEQGHSIKLKSKQEKAFTFEIADVADNELFNCFSKVIIG